jgi:hypothetical protein
MACAPLRSPAPLPTAEGRRIPARTGTAKSNRISHSPDSAVPPATACILTRDGQGRSFPPPPPRAYGRMAMRPRPELKDAETPPVRARQNQTASPIIPILPCPTAGCILMRDGQGRSFPPPRILSSRLAPTIPAPRAYGRMACAHPPHPGNSSHPRAGHSGPALTKASSSSPCTPTCLTYAQYRRRINTPHVSRITDHAPRFTSQNPPPE